MVDTPHGDFELLSAVMRIAADECAARSWEDIEPALAASWERLRRRDSPAWPAVAGRIRACCEELQRHS